MRYKVTHMVIVPGQGLVRLTPPIHDQSWLKARSLRFTANKIRRRMSKAQGREFSCKKTEHGYTVEAAGEEVRLVMERWLSRRGRIQ
jgi:hypothetical protein